MVVNLSELLALPVDQRLRLAEALVESAVPADLEPLLREFVVGMEQTNRAIEVTLARLDRLDETLERNRTEVRESVQRSAETWPFALPPAHQ